MDARKSRTSHRRLTVAIVTLLVLSGLGYYQVGVRSRRPASFRRGGAFVAARRLPAVPSLADGPFAPLDPTTVPGATASTSPSARVLGSTTARPSTSSTSSSSSSTSTSAGPASTLPRLGTYVWDVSGTESATGFGSRAFPTTMTMVAHAGDGDARQVVLDIAYSSNHNEREILGFRDNGIFFDFEAGQVRFGPSAQTNQGDYAPPMLQVPLAPTAGQVVKGTSQVKAADGSVQRTEDWTVKVLGQETIVVSGQPVPTWKITIDRQSRPGSSQEVTRSRTYWFDPAHHLWVRYAEKMHGQQSFGGLTFTYDNNLTATLRSFSA